MGFPLASAMLAMLGMSHDMPGMSLASQHNRIPSDLRTLDSRVVPGTPESLLAAGVVALGVIIVLVTWLVTGRRALSSQSQPAQRGWGDAGRKTARASFRTTPKDDGPFNRPQSVTKRIPPFTWPARYALLAIIGVLALLSNFVWPALVESHPSWHRQATDAIYNELGDTGKYDLHMPVTIRKSGQFLRVSIRSNVADECADGDCTEFVRVFSDPEFTQEIDYPSVYDSMRQELRMPDVQQWTAPADHDSQLYVSHNYWVVQYRQADGTELARPRVTNVYIYST